MLFIFLEISLSKKFTFIQFSLGKANYGINVGQAMEVERYVQLINVPRMPRFVQGLINLRGRVFTVIDLRRQLGLRPTNPTSETRIIIADISGEQVGFIVDYVDDIREVPLADVRSPGDFALKISNNFVTGVVEQDKDIIVLLNFDALMHASEIDIIRRLSHEPNKKAKKR
jgi:purine-binding chemotaxis protein CheW